MMITPPRSRSPQPAVNIQGFFDLVDQALKLHVQAEGLPMNGMPIFIEEYSQERLTKQDQTTDVITYRVSSSVMASNTNNGGAPKRLSLRDEVVHPTKGPNYMVSTYAWWENVQVEFCIWSRSNGNSNYLAEWFHLFLMKYGYINKFFLGRGVDNFEFVERRDDPVDHNSGQETSKRRLSYRFRLNRLYKTESRLLTDIDLTYGIGDQTDTSHLKSNQ